MPLAVKCLKILLAIVIFAVLLYNVGWRDLWQALSQLSLEAVVYLALLAVVLILLSSVKWKYFLESFGTKVSLLRLFSLYLVGYFVNLLMPSYLGGDLVRSWYIGRDVGQHRALAATILERYTGIVAMVLLALCFMWYVPMLPLEIKIAIIFIAFGLVCLTLAALSTQILSRLERIAALKTVVAHLRKVQEGFILARSDRGLLLKALVLSLVYHSVTVLNTMAAGYAVGWNNAPPFELFVVLPLILLIGALPVAPSGLGIQEGAFYFFLSVVGATPAQALGVAVVLRAKQYIIALIGGVVWLFFKGGKTE